MNASVVGLLLGVLIGVPSAVLILALLRFEITVARGSGGQTWRVSWASLQRLVVAMLALPTLWVGVPLLARAVGFNFEGLLPWYLAGVIAVVALLLLPLVVYFLIWVARESQPPRSPDAEEGQPSR